MNYNIEGMISTVCMYNGLDEEIHNWIRAEHNAKKRNEKYGFKLAFMFPTCYGWNNQQIEIIRMFMVLMFGDYGTSPRSGWIDGDKRGAFRRMCMRIVCRCKDHSENKHFFWDELPPKPKAVKWQKGLTWVGHITY